MKNKKLWILGAVSAAILILGLVSCGSSGQDEPKTEEIKAVQEVTVPASLSEEERIENLRNDILSFIAQSDGTYFKTLQYLDFTNLSLSAVPAAECTKIITTRVFDENGNIKDEQTTLGFVFGPYVVAPLAFVLSFPTRETANLTPPPGLTEEQKKSFEKLVESQLELLEKWLTDAYVFWENDIFEEGAEGFLAQRIEPIEIYDDTLKRELAEANIAIFERSPKNDEQGRPISFPECRTLSVATGNPGELQPLDLLVNTNILKDSGGIVPYSIVQGSYMGVAQSPNSFYFQGSIITKNLGGFIFALRKETQQWEAVGIITKTMDPVETRGTAVRIDYVLELLERIKDAPGETPEPTEEQNE